MANFLNAVFILFQLFMESYGYIVLSFLLFIGILGTLSFKKLKMEWWQPELGENLTKAFLRRGWFITIYSLAVIAGIVSQHFSWTTETARLMFSLYLWLIPTIFYLFSTLMRGIKAVLWFVGSLLTIPIVLFANILAAPEEVLSIQIGGVVFFIFSAFWFWPQRKDSSKLLRPMFLSLLMLPAIVLLLYGFLSTTYPKFTVNPVNASTESLLWLIGLIVAFIVPFPLRTHSQSASSTEVGRASNSEQTDDDSSYDDYASDSSEEEVKIIKTIDGKEFRETGYDEITDSSGKVWHATGSPDEYESDE